METELFIQPFADAYWSAMLESIDSNPQFSVNLRCKTVEGLNRTKSAESIFQEHYKGTQKIF